MGTVTVMSVTVLHNLHMRPVIRPCTWRSWQRSGWRNQAWLNQVFLICLRAQKSASFAAILGGRYFITVLSLIRGTKHNVDFDMYRTMRMLRAFDIHNGVLLFPAVGVSLIVYLVVS